MALEGEFSIHLTHNTGYNFNIEFDLDLADDLITDEPEPLGEGNGPNPSRLIAAAAANCLAASLLFCINKKDVTPNSLNACVTCHIERQQGRLRIANMQVNLNINPVLEQAIRMKRCLNLFESFCVATESLRKGFPIGVNVLNSTGSLIHQSHMPADNAINMKEET